MIKNTIIRQETLLPYDNVDLRNFLNDRAVTWCDKGLTQPCQIDYDIDYYKSFEDRTFCVLSELLLHFEKSIMQFFDFKAKLILFSLCPSLRVLLSTYMKDVAIIANHGNLCIQREQIAFSKYFEIPIVMKLTHDVIQGIIYTKSSIFKRIFCEEILREGVISVVEYEPCGGGFLLQLMDLWKRKRLLEFIKSIVFSDFDEDANKCLQDVNLESITIKDFSSFRGADVKFIQPMDKLKSINVAFISSEINFKNFIKLKYIHVENAGIRSVVRIEGMPNLEKVYFGTIFGSNSNITISGEFPQLEFIKFGKTYSNANITIAGKLPKLQLIDFTITYKNAKIKIFDDKLIKLEADQDEVGKESKKIRYSTGALAIFNQII
jgi:hypothetical protein